jgi:hypothetical protein
MIPRRKVLCTLAAVTVAGAAADPWTDFDARFAKIERAHAAIECRLAAIKRGLDGHQRELEQIDRDLAKDIDRAAQLVAVAQLKTA